jgi:hypothetical protein
MPCAKTRRILAHGRSRKRKYPSGLITDCKN